uniref:CSD domain-containing protein n=1 Tax=Pyrodinium bahamense TaxID=73915 RepID=A0A7S0API2_9DINO
MTVNGGEHAAVGGQPVAGAGVPDPGGDAGAVERRTAGSPTGSARRRKRHRKEGEEGAASCQSIKEGLVGTIRMFNADKGWGFIDGDTAGKDIFLHAKHIVGSVPSFWIGHKMTTKDRDKAPRSPASPVRVAFDLALSAGGKPQAVNVRVLGCETEGQQEEDGSPVLAADDDWRPPVSPTCANCGSTVATHLGIDFCPICRFLAPATCATR